MKKKILLVAPVHDYYEFLNGIKIDRNINFPIEQWQYHWEKAIIGLWYKVFIFRYTDLPFFSKLLWVKIISFFQSKINLIYKIIDRFFFLFPYLSFFNYIRNYTLLKNIKNNKIDILIFSWWTTKIFPFTLKKIKSKWCKIIFFHWMSPLIWSNKFERKFTKEWDYIFTNDSIHAKEWYILWNNNSYALPISSFQDNFVDKKLDFINRKYDITFIWRLSPENIYKKRIETLKYLQLKFWNKLNVWTNDLNIIKKYSLENNYRWNAFWNLMIDIFKKSKIVINDHWNTMPWWWNMRTFEICWCWALQILDFTDSAWFNENSEVIKFYDNNDLYDKIKYFLKNDEDRIKISKAWYYRILNEHLYLHHFKKLFNIILKK